MFRAPPTPVSWRRQPAKVPCRAEAMVGFRNEATVASLYGRYTPTRKPLGEGFGDSALPILAMVSRRWGYSTILAVVSDRPGILEGRGKASSTDDLPNSSQ